MRRVLEALKAVLDLAGEELALEECHEKIDQLDYDWFVHDIGSLAMKSKAMIDKIKYTEVKE